MLHPWQQQRAGRIVQSRKRNGIFSSNKGKAGLAALNALRVSAICLFARFFIGVSVSRVFALSRAGKSSERSVTKQPPVHERRHPSLPVPVGSPSQVDTRRPGRATRGQVAAGGQGDSREI